MERAINAGTSRERIMMGILVLTSIVALGMCACLAKKLDRATKRLDALETPTGRRLLPILVKLRARSPGPLSFLRGRAFYDGTDAVGSAYPF